MTDLAEKTLMERGLKVIKSDVMNIAKRIKEYDKNLITVYNPKKNEYQVYDTTKFPVLLMATWMDKLDARLIERVKRADGRTSYGFKAKMDEIEAEKQKSEADEKKDAYETANAIARSMVGANKGLKHYI